MSQLSADNQSASTYSRLRQRLIQDSIFYAGIRGVATASSFIMVILLSRLLVPADVGRYTLVLNAAALVSLFAFSWIGTTVYRYSPEYAEGNALSGMRSLVLRLYASVGVVIAAAALAAEALQLPLISGLGGSLIVPAAVLLAVTGPASSCTDLLRVEGQRGAYAGAMAALYLGPIALLLSATVMDEVDLIHALISQAIPTAGIVIVSLGIWGSRRQLDRDRAIALLKRCRSYGVPLVGAGVASWALSVSDRYVLVLLETSKQVGIYTVGYQIGSAPILLLYAVISSLLEPLLFSAHASMGAEKAEQVLGKAFAVVLATLGIAAILLSMQGSTVIDLIIGDRYSGSARIVPFAAVGTGLLSLGMIRQQLLSLEGTTRPIFRALVVASLVNISATFILVSWMSVVGAGIATVIGYGTYLILVMRSTGKTASFKVPGAWLAGIVRAIVGAASVAVVFRFLVPDFFLKPVVETAVTCIVYLFMMQFRQEDSVLSFMNRLRLERVASDPEVSKERND
jgi:O-antigen/teichoic acid export membrane protein